jgi:carbon starvation protein CstA
MLLLGVVCYICGWGTTTQLFTQLIAFLLLIIIVAAIALVVVAHFFKFPCLKVVVLSEIKYLFIYLIRKTAGIFHYF